MWREGATAAGLATIATFDELVALVRAYEARGEVVYLRYAAPTDIEAQYGSLHVSGCGGLGMSVNPLSAYGWIHAPEIFIAFKTIEYSSFLIFHGLFGMRGILCVGQVGGYAREYFEICLIDVQPLALLADLAINEARALWFREKDHYPLCDCVRNKALGSVTQRCQQRCDWRYGYVWWPL